jgi:hypothetical protein
MAGGPVTSAVSPDERSSDARPGQHPLPAGRKTEMIDKLDLEVKEPFNAEFARAWNNSANDELFKKTHGGLYLVAADLRGVGIPARLSVGHKHHKKLGAKFEIIGAGEMGFSQWAETCDQVFKGDCYANKILRADCTADVRDVSVSELGRAMTVKYKQTTRQFFGEDEQRYNLTPQLVSAVQRLAAETQTYGNKPRQIRVYDKTRHRKDVLLREMHYWQRRRGEPLSTFEEAFGLDPRQMVTRIERQMGAREPRDVWGVDALGEIHKLAERDPWERMKFARDARVTKNLAALDPVRRMLILSLRERIETRGLDQARAWARGHFELANSFRKWWRENEHLLLESGPVISRAQLTEEFRSTTIEQLAA